MKVTRIYINAYLGNFLLKLSLADIGTSRMDNVNDELTSREEVVLDELSSPYLNWLLITCHF